MHVSPAWTVVNSRGQRYANRYTAAVAATVLIVDDEKEIRELLRYNLERQGYNVLTAHDGEEGLARAFATHPDLILLDLHLPGCPGEEVLAQIRLDAELAPTPVVIVTADLAPGTERRLMQGGATAFLSKPVDIGLVLSLVDRTVRQRA